MFGVAIGSSILAAWLVPASVHIVAWTSASAERVALLPNLGSLRLPAALGVVAALAGMIVRARYGQPHFHRLVRALGPLCLLLVWGLPYLPWVPDRFPLLLILAGPVRWLIAAAAVIACAAIVANQAAAGLKWRAPGSWIVFGLTLLLYLGLGLRATGRLGPGGDEPHYLVITHSLLVDHDLQIENNHVNGDYRAFFEGLLRPDFLRRGMGRVIYSVHAPGLPALLVPAYAVAGYRGVVVTMCLLSALTALLVFRLARLVTGPSAAILTWIAVAFTMPVGVMSWMVYPEVPAALIVAACAWWLWTAVPDSILAWIGRGALLAVLPWLHAKFIVLIVGLAAGLLIRIAWRPRLIIALMAPMAVSVVIWLYAFYVMYGVVDPFIPYGSGSLQRFSSGNIPRGVLGLLFDQEYGLLTYAPVYALALPSLAAMMAERRTRFYTLAAVLCAGTFLAGVTRQHMWWGGTSPPARFMLPLLPLFTPMVATAFRDWTGWRRGASLAALVVAVTIFGYVSLQPELRLMTQNRDGISAFIEYVQAGAPLTAVLPSFIEEDWIEQAWRILPWLAALLLGVWAARLIDRRRTPGGTSPFWSGSVLTLVTLVGGLILATPLIPVSDRESIVTEGRLALVTAYDPRRVAGFDYRTRQKLSGSRVLERAIVVVTPTPGPESAVLCGPFDLPAGEYEVTARVTGEVRDPGMVRVVSSHPGRRVILASGILQRGSVTIRVPLRSQASRFTVEGLTEADARLVDRVEIRPLSIVPRTSRDGSWEAVAVKPLDSSGGYLFFMDGHTYPEDLWVKGEQRSTLLVAPAGATMLRLSVQRGASAGRVTVSVDGRETVLSLEAGETRHVEIAVRPDSPLVSIAIAPSGGFRPADRNPNSKDDRWLGCRVTITLLDSQGIARVS